jgi:hypothetical protein
MRKTRFLGLPIVMTTLCLGLLPISAASADPSGTAVDLASNQAENADDTAGAAIGDEMRNICDGAWIGDYTSDSGTVTKNLTGYSGGVYPPEQSSVTFRVVAHIYQCAKNYSWYMNAWIRNNRAGEGDSLGGVAKLYDAVGNYTGNTVNFNWSSSQDFNGHWKGRQWHFYVPNGQGQPHAFHIDGQSAWEGAESAQFVANWRWPASGGWLIHSYYNG